MLINYGSCVVCLNNRDAVIDLRYVDFITIIQSIGNSLTNLAADYNTFKTQVTQSDIYKFTYDGSNWSLNGNIVNITDYGISFTGTPAIGDELTVEYEQTDDTLDLRFTNEAITEKDDLGTL